MKKFYVLPLLAFITIPSYGQSQIKKYVESNAISINSIQPDFADYTDLEPIGKAIGDARIVMLGEQGHGDGAAFLAKTRLVKYLHEQKGFNVIAFEGDFFGLNAGWDEIRKEREQISKFLYDNVYTVWTRSKQCSDLLYDYIPGSYQTNIPLKVTGFDIQLYLDHSARHLKIYIDTSLRQTNIAFVKTKAYQDEFLPAVEGLTKGWLVGKETELKVLEDHVAVILNQLGDRNNEYNWLLLKNIQSFAAANLAARNHHEATEIRDRQMAENLEWLVRKKFPNEKVIVWAANAHVSKNATTAFKFKNSRKNWMGTIFTSDSLNNASTYVLGIASRSGVHQNVLEPTPTKVNAPQKKGLEN
ncbi:erythromycin esterase family protein [Pontibacter virosus]|uniref:Erythromycin esterase n=1 Tax=Pontibacter virosus TaxID=1765052 RepID=A0A2U1ASH4_9BACT|nr:erythromycin esterase family protein [Pontibacter virosus]PVY39394.1 erythromycin esterase [Pontibacter virosus]